MEVVAYRWRIECIDGNCGIQMEDWVHTWKLWHTDGGLGAQMEVVAYRWRIGCIDGSCGIQMQDWAHRWKLWQTD